MPAARRQEQPVDIVLFGATGFVGRITAAYLARQAPATTRIALAGRSAGRLDAVRDELGERAAGWSTIVADSSDAGAMEELAARTAVVATTVGPYARYGVELVGACARAGTHYADLTGEVLFVRESIDRFDTIAARRGARVVHACGFDSIPSDLGVQLLHRQVAADGAGTLGATTLVAHLKGGVSGGTIDSMRTQVDAVRAHPALRKIVADPYALSPDRQAEPDPGDGPDGWRARYDDLVGEWTIPFVMGPFNTRVVRRSNALQDWAYGRSFRYNEVMAAGRGPVGLLVAGGMSAGQVGMTAAMGIGATRALLDRVLPKAGSGPSPATQRLGWFRVDIHAATTSGARYLATIGADGDPGYAATAVMLGESALCLASDEATLPPRAGVLTPATAMGEALLRRLEGAGFRTGVQAASTPRPG